jgi:hypothetical protein
MLGDILWASSVRLRKFRDSASNWATAATF